MSSRRRSIVVLTFLLPLASGATLADPGIVRWIRPDGTAAWSAPVPGPSSSAAGDTPLTVEPWLLRPGNLDVHLADGSTLPLGGLRGRVVVLDFWASWCAPCVHELPQLQALLERLRPRGLAAIAINADEAAETARAAAEGLGLTLPVGLYSRALDDAFEVRSLPTVVLLDRDGRVRDRWNGYQPGLERAIAARAEAVLDDSDAIAPELLGSVSTGAGTLVPRWSRALRGVVEGVAVVRTGDTPRVVAVSDGALVGIAEDGRIVGEVRAARGMGRLRCGDVTGDGVADLVGFRRGSDRVGVVDMARRASTTWEAPAPVLDLAILPAPPEAGPAGIALATPDGLIVAGADGRVRQRVGGSSLAVASGRDDRGVVLLRLGDGRRVDRVDGSGAVVSSYDPVAGSSGLVPPSDGADGFGTVPGTVVGAAVGRFGAAGSGSGVALATRDGVVTVLASASGTVVFSASWPGAGALAAGDLDGDGLDELVVASGNRVSLLGVPENLQKPHNAEIDVP